MEAYWDGGYTGNPALFPLFKEPLPGDVVIVNINPLEREEIPKTPQQIRNRVNEISFNSTLLRELRAISFVHKLLDDGWLKDEFRKKLRDIRIHSIRSDEIMADYDIASKFRTDWPFLSELKDRGRNVADAWLEKNFDAIGSASSVNLREMFE